MPYQPSAGQCNKCGHNKTWESKIPNPRSGKMMPAHIDAAGNLLGTGECPAYLPGGSNYRPPVAAPTTTAQPDWMTQLQQPPAPTPVPVPTAAPAPAAILPIDQGLLVDDIEARLDPFFAAIAQRIITIEDQVLALVDRVTTVAVKLDKTFVMPKDSEVEFKKWLLEAIKDNPAAFQGPPAPRAPEGEVVVRLDGD